MLTKNVKKGIKISAIVAAIIYITLQIGIAFYQMPDQTMENTIKKGEWIAINKIAVGDYFLGFKLPSLSKIERGDLVYMFDPTDVDNPLYNRKKMISRVVALPKDAFELTNRALYVNNELVKEQPTIKQGYRVVVNDGVSLDSAFFGKYGLTEFIREDTKSELADKYKDIYKFEYSPVEIWEVPMTAEKALEVEKDSLLSYVRMIRARVPGRYFRTWPYSSYWFWNRWSTSPTFEVPGKGTVVSINFRTLAGYEELIEKYEGNKLDATLDNAIYINGSRVNSYTVKENYYIVLSDNRDRYFDLRSFGLVPESMIIGKVINKN
ncbi:MAG: signal peptidase I [Salinivirgaceae bacterium]|nr:signal peptidase I [Salinivirgaceae bacterium]MDD4747255.1 signal peptidase I [Salinivirgaceae bacterium]MDY0281613.1 signal peptidase I [Salinivirgaceae bacterium]